MPTCRGTDLTQFDVYSKLQAFIEKSRAEPGSFEEFEDPLARRRRLHDLVGVTCQRRHRHRSRLQRQLELTGGRLLWTRAPTRPPRAPRHDPRPQPGMAREGTK